MKDDDSFSPVGRPDVVIKVGDFAKHDVCFGRHAKTSDDCKACRMPVTMNGRLLLFKDMCAARTAGVEVGTLNRISEGEVRKRLEDGRSVYEVWREILGDCDPKGYAREARTVLYQRLSDLKKEYGFKMPKIPRTQELIDVYMRERGGV